MGEGEGRGGSQLLIALIIAIVGLFMYWGQTEKNPITGQSQHISITPDQEIRLGLQAAPQMAAQMGGEVPNSDPRAQKVETIGQYLIAHSDARKGPWQFDFHLLADAQTINAFALPGGQIFITLGLYNKLNTEAELAGVLAHEIGHVIQRHSAQQMAKGQLGQILVVATGVGAGSSHNSPQSAAAVASVINQMVQLRYGRKDELEADEWGLLIMTQAGYNPYAMLQVMKILEKAVPRGQTPEMLLTHPYPEQRIKKIEEYLKKNPPKEGLMDGKKLKWAS